MEVKTAECPLGAKCEEVKAVNSEQVLFRCPWFQKIEGMHPQTGEKLNQWNCAIGWIPMLMTNMAREVNQGAAATESFRNIMVRMAQGESPTQIEKSYDRTLLNGSEKVSN